MDNPKNRLQELVQKLGHEKTCISYYLASKNVDNEYYMIGVLTMPYLKIEKTGIGLTKKEAEKRAAQTILTEVATNHSALMVNMAALKVEAQAGDALIKLCGYLSKETEGSAENSYWLQKYETNRHLALLFDKLLEEKHPFIWFLGKNLKEHTKATYIEALICREFKEQLLNPQIEITIENLASFLKF